MHNAVERAIAVMWERFDEPISLTDLADAAILSRFYFSRVFRSITGTSPGRFLSAIRIHQAKSLLLDTAMSVTDISYQVGYNSPGTFTSRFTRSVGMTPTQYRDLSGSGISPPVPPAAGTGDPAVQGVVLVPDTDTPLRIYVAAFRTPIPEGLPVSCDVLDADRRRFTLPGLPDGTWYVRAAAVEYLNLNPRPSKRRPLFVSGGPSITVRSGRNTAAADVALHPLGVFDLPVLIALPELDSCEPQQQVLAPVAVGC
jgi:AraC family transcriptional regulator